MIDVGCGAGASTKTLLDAGFDVLAIEPSAALLTIAQRAAAGAAFRHASVYDTPLVACDAILALGEPLSYHEPHFDADARLRRFFDAAHEALTPGGLLAFDVIETGEPALDARGWRSGPDWVLLHEAREDAAARRLTRTIEVFRRTADGTYRRSQERHEVRLFGRSAVTAWLEHAGFDAHAAPAYGRVPLLPRRIAFLATRRG